MIYSNLIIVPIEDYKLGMELTLEEIKSNIS